MRDPTHVLVMCVNACVCCVCALVGVVISVRDPCVCAMLRVCANESYAGYHGLVVCEVKT